MAWAHTHAPAACEDTMLVLICMYVTRFLPQRTWGLGRAWSKKFMFIFLQSQDRNANTVSNQATYMMKLTLNRNCCIFVCLHCSRDCTTCKQKVLYWNKSATWQPIKTPNNIATIGYTVCRWPILTFYPEGFPNFGLNFKISDKR